jgi:hypothetical protein
MATTINPSNQVITQYSVMTGDANNLLNNVTPGLAGTVLTSNGVSAQPTFQAGGGGGVSGPGSSTDRAIATWNGTGGTALFDNSTTNISSTGSITNTGQPAFAYTLSGNLTGIAGVNLIPFDTVNFDQTSNFSVSTYLFTAPITGIYKFDYILYMTSISLATQVVMYMTGTGGSFNLFDLNAVAIQDASSNLCLSGSLICSLNSSENIGAYIYVAAPGTVTIASGTNATRISGYLIC